METLLKTLLSLIESGESAALAIVVRTDGSSPRKAGAKMVIRQTGTTIGTLGGGDLEKRVMEQGGLDMRCGGTVDIYIEPLFSKERLIIFGAGHITRALFPIMAKTGFRVTVVDDKPDHTISEQMT